MRELPFVKWGVKLLKSPESFHIQWHQIDSDKAVKFYAANMWCIFIIDTTYHLASAMVPVYKKILTVRWEYKLLWVFSKYQTI